MSGYLAQRAFRKAQRLAAQMSGDGQAVIAAADKLKGLIPDEAARTVAMLRPIKARIAQAQGDHAQAVAQFEKAATLQDTLPYMEPPYWYYPVRQSLGAALVLAGRHDDALEQFRLSLQRAPNNGWSYYGLVELHKARGDALAMGLADEQLAKTWLGDRQLLRLSSL